MQVAYSFKNISPAEKAFCQNYFDGKLAKLQKIIDRLYAEACLDFRAEKFVKKSAYKVSLAIHSSPPFFVAEDDHTLPEAIDLALDKLVLDLRKVQEVRKEKR